MNDTNEYIVNMIKERVEQSSDMSYIGFASNVILLYVEEIRRHQASIYSGKNVIALHQFRVNCRRLRNSLKIFKNIFSKKELKKWDQNIRLVTKASSDVRDLDVLIEFLKQYVLTLKSFDCREDIQDFILYLDNNRDGEQLSIIKYLDAMKQGGVLLHIDNFFKNSFPIEKSAGYKYIYKMGYNRIHKRILIILQYEKIVTDPTQKDELHQMRIAIKHLRYTWECLAPVYNEDSLILETILSFHRVLGDVHDFDVWGEFVSKYLNEVDIQDRKYQSLIALKEYCDGQRKRYYDQFIENWRSVRAQRFFEEMLEMLYAYKEKV